MEENKIFIYVKERTTEDIESHMKDYYVVYIRPHNQPDHGPEHATGKGMAGNAAGRIICSCIYGCDLDDNFEMEDDIDPDALQFIDIDDEDLLCDDFMECDSD